MRDGGLLQAQHPGEQRWSSPVSARVPGGFDEHAQFLRAVRVGELVLRGHLHRPQAALAMALSAAQRRPGGQSERAERQREQQCGAFGVADRPRLGRHLPDHHVQEHHDGQGDEERDRVGPAPAARSPSNSRVEQMRDRRARRGRRGRASRAVMPNCAPASISDSSRRTGQRRRCGAAAGRGGLFEAVALGGDEGELGGDEEPVACQQPNGHDQRPGGAHDEGPTLTRTVSGTWRSTVSTSTVTRRPRSVPAAPAGTSTVTRSPGTGTCPSCRMTRPETVS